MQLDADVSQASSLLQNPVVNKYKPWLLRRWPAAATAAKAYFVILQAISLCPGFESFLVFFFFS
jgi:hypothetical protein